ncbi:hypothetical protein FHS89_000319 [Rubricella aquisinus]|uniref:Uncharacterized protein n=1 Tax=Rubricella aquisinus TaxID=2028108 RepID=A0A840WIJ9_9RHOB|nr:PDC sensor domain-containing protein [Rubricella aquisinus]MBB5514321.1 hypothetical protein [Rubricella aquisinus]
MRIILILFLSFLTAAPALATDDLPYRDIAGQIAGKLLEGWISDPVVIYSIEEQNTLNADLADAQVAALQSRWIAEDGRGEMSFDLLDRLISIIAREEAEKSGGMIDRIAIMDMHGITVGMTRAAPDYYQGDKPHFVGSYLMGPDGQHISEPYTATPDGDVLVDITRSVVAEDGVTPIGAVTLTLNVGILF